MSAVVAGTDDPYVQQFAELSGRLPGSAVPWLHRRREEALDQFSRLGFPTTRDEDWKYTNVRPIIKRPFELASECCVGLVEDDLGDDLLPELEAHRLVFVNGRLAPQLSRLGDLPEGVSLDGLARLLDSEPESVETYLGRLAKPSAHGFAALNLAYMTDGAVLRVGKGVAMEHPIHLLYVATPQAAYMGYHLRNLVIAEEGSRAQVIEHYVTLGEAVCLNNVVTEVAVGASATVAHYKLQQESEKTYHVATLEVQQVEASRFDSYSVSMGGALTRNDINASLDAEGAHCELIGLYVAGGRQHVDYHTRVHHLRPEGTSREFYRGVLSGRGRGVFNGQVYVHPGAQKTDATQSNNNLLLSPDAEVDTKPQLEIYADDVSCSHGATVGQLDPEMLFYLRSRGIPEPMARGMLTYGFARDLVERIGIAPIRHRIEVELTRRLPNADVIEVE